MSNSVEVLLVRESGEVSLVSGSSYVLVSEERGSIHLVSESSEVLVRAVRSCGSAREVISNADESVEIRS